MFFKNYRENILTWTCTNDYAFASIVLTNVTNTSLTSNVYFLYYNYVPHTNYTEKIFEVNNIYVDNVTMVYALNSGRVPLLDVLNYNI